MKNFSLDNDYSIKELLMSIKIYLINHASAETLTTGRMISLVHQQRYRHSDSNENIDFKISAHMRFWNNFLQVRYA